MAARSHRLSAGVVVLRRSGEGCLYLLLRAYRYWDFPKGEVGPGEEAIAAARREVLEETGIDDLAFRWMSAAAEQGHAAAQHSLGLMYAKGRGVPRDYVEAYKWFNLAVEDNDEMLKDAAVYNRDLVASKMTPAQIAEAQRLAREWKPKTSETTQGK